MIESYDGSARSVCAAEAERAWFYEISYGPRRTQTDRVDRLLPGTRGSPVLSKHAKHVPKHRGAPARPSVPDAVVEAPRKAVSATLLFSSLAVAATGVAVVGGLSAEGGASAAALDRPEAAGVGGGAVSAPDSAALAAAEPVTRRVPTLSRSADRREGSDPAKEAALAADATGTADSGSEDLADNDPRDIAMALLGDFGFSSDQFGCLDSLYTRESGWNVVADNPTSSAYGIPQALPGSKMSTAGADWATNPVTQIRWGLGYIRDRYGSPCGAWAHSESVGWY